ncbi:MAG: redoxin domain-containing protein [Bacteroidales bacterium]|nr:redoxin domain-containing protein [Bacteroidales bacterium]
MSILKRNGNKQVMLMTTYQILVSSLSCLFCFLWGHKQAYPTVLLLIFFLYSLAINVESRKISYLWVILPVVLYALFRFSNGFESGYIQDPRLWKIVSLFFVLMLAGYAAGYFLSKCKAKTVYLTVLIVITLIIHVLGNITSWSLSFMTTGIIFLIAPYIAYRYISQKKYIPLILVAPVMLLNLESWLSSSIGALPLTLVPLCSVGIYYLVFLLREQRVFQLVLISIYTMFLVYGWYKGFADYRQWITVQQAKLAHDTYAEYIFYNIEGQVVTPEIHVGKIVVFDFWTTSCGICFREFPEFDRVYQKYNHLADIMFYAVNLPIKSDTRESIVKTIAGHINYSFPILLADEDSDYWTQFKIRGVPHLMILDKAGKVVFNGGVNYERRRVYNIEDVIDNLLKK